MLKKEIIGLLHQHRLERLLVIDKKDRLKGLITVKDIQKSTDHPNACKDEHGRLRVGAAVGIGEDTDQRVELLVEAKGILVLSVEAETELNKVILKPKATSNPIDDGGLKVKEIKVNDCFELDSGRRFKLIKKRRTRFLCSDLITGKLYAVSGEATVNQLLD